MQLSTRHCVHNGCASCVAWATNEGSHEVDIWCAYASRCPTAQQHTPRSACGRADLLACCACAQAELITYGLRASMARN